MFGLQGWLEAERRRLFLWLPLCLSLGIALWMGWRGEPDLAAYLALGFLGLASLGLAFVPHLVARPLGIAGVTIAVGFQLMGLRSEMVAAPILQGRYFGPIEGRISHIDRGASSDKMRLTLDEVRLPKRAPDQTPAVVRVTLHADQPHFDPVVGMRVMMTGYLSPPEGPAEPGGFDFQRFAWFRSLGAVGYVRGAVLPLAQPKPWELGVARLRMHLSKGVQASIKGEAGAFASAMMTGDRSGMGREAVGALRDSGLYHLVSISGVHMSLLASFVFLGLRGGIAAIPPLALRVSGKKLAAFLALLASGFYLVLSGGDVATLRAFVMVAVMLVAVFFDRRAISLRSIAMAALIILCLTPEALFEPGFQMSFAATIALVMGLERLNRVQMPWGVKAGVVLLVSSLLAGFASAPFAAAHFNRFSEYGLLANLVTGPLMGALVMPAGVIAAALAPFGLAAPALWVLGLGTEAILWVAHWVASMEGAVRMMPSPPNWMLGVLGLTSCLLVLLRGRARWGPSLALIVLALLWSRAERPAVLIASDGNLVAILGPEGRVLSKDRANAFAARSWLESDGDAAAAKEASARAGFSGPRQRREALWQGIKIIHLTGKSAGLQLAEACQPQSLVVTEQSEITRSGILKGPCALITPALLREAGALALSLQKGRLSWNSAMPESRRRWHQPAKSKAREVLTAELSRLGPKPPPSRAPKPSRSQRRLVMLE